jgi:hypothetical protein
MVICRSNGISVSIYLKSTIRNSDATCPSSFCFQEEVTLQFNHKHTKGIFCGEQVKMADSDIQTI